MKSNKKSIIIAIAKGYHFDSRDNLIGVRKKIIHPSIDTVGYPYFNVVDNNKRYRVLVHRLKAYFLFGDEIFREEYEVRHLNGNKTDWSDKNLKIGTTRDNRLDMPVETRIKTAVIATSYIRKINEEQREEIRALKESGMRLIDIAKKYGLKSKGTVSMIINRVACYKNKAHQ